ncbi:hypothetical protein ACFC26_12905 [Kitasatospora purpeofusca]|uniref:hypothetical protein n=1 Tax=Kitasatospora purpeofusca TaxID=67352 RepID=UPI0035DAEDD1
MTDDQPAPNYRAYSGEDEATGARFVIAYAGDEEADDDRKEQLRAMAKRVIADLVAERQTQQGTKPALRLVRGDGS